MTNLNNLILFSLLMFMANNSHAKEQNENKPWVETLYRNNNIRVVKIHFYVQDFLGGKNPTVYEVARASITSNSTTAFGKIQVVDDLLTTDPDINSKKLGRVQGLVTSADLAMPGVAINLNFLFTVGKYNGSTISILGRNQALDKQRELAIVGGTGIFRFAQGYAITKTHLYDAKTLYAVLEYTLYVRYYTGEFPWLL